VVDFFCAAARLAIELDGSAHDYASAQEHDRARDAYLLRAGIRVLRFENRDVLTNLDGVLAEIARHLRAPTTPPASQAPLLRQEGRK